MTQKLKRYDLYDSNFYPCHRVEESINGKYVKFSDIEPLIEAVRFYGNKSNWKRDWDAHRAGIEEWQYSVMTHDLEEQNENASYGGKKARQALKSIGVEV